MNRQALGDWVRRNRFLLAFATLSSLMGISIGVAKIASSLYALELGANATQLGLIASGQMVGTLAMSLPTGVLVDRFGPARLFVLGSALAGLTFALVPAVASVAFLLGCLTATSFFMPLRFVSLNTIFLEQLRQMGEGKAGWFRGTHLSGQFLIGPGLAVGLLGAFGYAGTWWVLAATFALTIVLSPIVFRQHAARHKPRPGGSANVREITRELLVVARDQELRKLCTVEFWTQATMLYQSTFIVAIALQTMRLDAAHASAYVTGSGVAFIGMLLFGGPLVARWGARTSALLGFAVVGISLVIQGLAPGPGSLWPGVVLQGLGIGLVQITNLTRVARVGARLGQGKVSGVLMLAPPLGALTGTIFGGLLGQSVGLQLVFLLFLPAFMWLAWRQWRAGAAEAHQATR